MATLTPYNIYLIPDLPALKANLEAVGAKKFKAMSANNARLMISGKYMDYVKPFVPKNIGDLRASGSVWNDGTMAWTARNYRTNFHYAGYVYDEGNELNYTTAGTGPVWDERFEASPQYEDFMCDVAKILVAAWEKG